MLPIGCGVLCLSLFCCTLLCVFSSFAIILKRKRGLFALLLLSYRCLDTVNVTWLLLTVPWVGLRCVILVFLDHIHFFGGSNLQINSNFESTLLSKQCKT